MPQDPTVQVAVVGVMTTLITTLGVIFVAAVNNRKERSDAADEGIASTLRERITLRDEQILDLRAELVELAEQIRKFQDERTEERGYP